MASARCLALFAVALCTVNAVALDIIIGEPDTLMMVPFNGISDNATRFQCLYYQEEIEYAGEISEISIEYDIFNGTFYDYHVYLCHTTVDELSKDFNKNYDGNTPKEVAAHDEYTIGVFGGYGWWPLGFQRRFNYDNADNLLLEITWEGDTGEAVDNSHWAYGGQRRGLHSDSATGEEGEYRPVSYIKVTFAEDTPVQPVSVGALKAVFR